MINIVELKRKINRRYFMQCIRLFCYKHFKQNSKNSKIKYSKKYIENTGKNTNVNMKKSYIIFDTSIGSENLGDQIINDYCNKIFDDLEIHPLARITTHQFPSTEEENLINPDSVKIITGTNILSSKMSKTSIWHRPSKFKLQDNCCLMGAGWLTYDGSIDYFTKRFFNDCLSKELLHSVRDSYTLTKLKEAGITNVVNTACPTMWNLTKEFCKQIPESKEKMVISTITDYNRNEEMDWFMLDTLLKLYDKVFIWIQGSNDLDYLKTYPRFHQLITVPNTLNAYDEILKNNQLDYVGTRLHAGIRALNYKKRSLVIAIDHRAIEIAKDTNIPIVLRAELKEKLEQFIESDYETNIELPIENINQWKKQFKNK